MLACQQRYHRGKIASGTSPTDGQARGVTVEGRGVLRDPASSVVRIVYRRGKLVFWCMAVVNRGHDAPDRVADRATARIVGFEIADHPTAAVKIYIDGKRAVSIGCVQSYGDVTVIAANDAVFYPGHTLARSQ